MAQYDDGAVICSEAHAIDQRHAVYEKFSDCVDDLALVSKVGDGRYGGEPRQALDRLIDHDDQFHTDIQGELAKIEENLRRQKLESQWKRENEAKMGGPDVSQQDLDADRDAWVEEMLGRNRGRVNCRLPTGRILPGTAATHSHIQSRLRMDGSHSNPQYEQKLQAKQRDRKLPDQKVQLGDWVESVDGEGEATKVWVDQVEIEIDVEGNPEKRRYPITDVNVMYKGHPAKAVTHQRPRPTARKPYSGPLKSHAEAGAGRSEIAYLFSKQHEQVQPGFLSPGEGKQQMENAMKYEKARNPGAAQRSRTADDAGKLPLPGRPRGTVGVAPRFMDVHAATDATQTRTIEKRAGEALPLKWDPETLRVVEPLGRAQGCSVVGGDPTLSDLRGMRLTHVWFTAGEPTREDALHTPSDVRRALGRAAQADLVNIRTDKWTRKWAVEKKRSEQAERTVGGKPPRGAAKR